MQQVLILPGDGIGPEVTGQAVRVLEAAAKRFGLRLGFESGLIDKLVHINRDTKVVKGAKNYSFSALLVASVLLHDDV